MSTNGQKHSCVEKICECLFVAVDLDHFVLDVVKRIEDLLNLRNFPVEYVMRVNQFGVHFFAALGNEFDGSIDKLWILGVQLFTQNQSALQFFAMFFKS